MNYGNRFEEGQEVDKLVYPYDGIIEVGMTYNIDNGKKIKRDKYRLPSFFLVNNC